MRKFKTYKRAHDDVTYYKISINEQLKTLAVYAIECEYEHKTALSRKYNRATFVYRIVYHTKLYDDVHKYGGNRIWFKEIFKSRIN